MNGKSDEEQMEFAINAGRGRQFLERRLETVEPSLILGISLRYFACSSI